LPGGGRLGHDTDAKNNGRGSLNPAGGSYLNQFRMDEGVDTSYARFHDPIDNSPYNLVQPPQGQLYVGWTEPGEWFNMTVRSNKVASTPWTFYTLRAVAVRYRLI
jgi:hypothetical protein